MKKSIILFLMFSSFLLNAQEEKTNVSYIQNIETKITSLNFASNSISELKNIDWKGLKSIFDSNNPEEKVELSFQIDLEKSKNKLKSTFKVSGETKNLDSLILIAKNGLDGLIRISSNNEKN